LENEKKILTRIWNACRGRVSSHKEGWIYHDYKEVKA